MLRTADFIGGVTVEPLFQRPCSDLQGSITHGRFQCFEIEVFNGFCAQKILDLFGQTDLQPRRAPVFLNSRLALSVGACSCASQTFSLTSTKSRVKSRNRLYSAI